MAHPRTRRSSGRNRARREQHRVAERAREPRLGARAEHVSAHVEQDDEIAAEPIGGRLDPAGDPSRAAVDVDERRRAAEMRGDAGLRQARSLGRPPLGPAERGVALAESLDPAQVRERARAGVVGVDREPLPGHPAELGRSAGALDLARRGDCADDVTAAPDPEDERAGRSPEGTARDPVELLRRVRAQARAGPRRRCRESRRRRGRTRRQPSPGRPRRGGRGRSRPTSGSRCARRGRAP